MDVYGIVFQHAVSLTVVLLKISLLLVPSQSPNDIGILSFNNALLFGPICSKQLICCALGDEQAYFD